MKPSPPLNTTRISDSAQAAFERVTSYENSIMPMYISTVIRLPGMTMEALRSSPSR